jgi:hypothetical protein
MQLEQSLKLNVQKGGGGGGKEVARGSAATFFPLEKKFN